MCTGMAEAVCTGVAVAVCIGVAAGCLANYLLLVGLVGWVVGRILVLVFSVICFHRSRYCFWTPACW